MSWIFGDLKQGQVIFIVLFSLEENRACLAAS